MSETDCRMGLLMQIARFKRIPFRWSQSITVISLRFRYFDLMYKKLPLPFLFVALAGIALGALMSLKALIPYLYWGDISEFLWHRNALPHIINYAFWPLLVPFVYWVFLKFNLGKEAEWTDRTVTFAFGLLIPFVHEVLTTVIYFFLLSVMDIYHITDNTWSKIKIAFPGVYLGRVIEFWIIYGLFGAFDYYKRFKNKQAELSRIEAQLARTKLEVLKMQLQPHFLFNALNTISGLMEIDIKKAQHVTARLGDLLRGILYRDSGVFVSFEEEINYVKTYLDIEKIRFEDRLEIEYDIDQNLLPCYVPLLIVQPLAENAIKHGFSKSLKKGKLKISASDQGTHLKIVVADDGVGQPADSALSLKKGIGLHNINERLKELYKGASEMLITCASDKGFVVELNIPKNYQHASN